jgi:hypothetical protein
MLGRVPQLLWDDRVMLRGVKFAPSTGAVDGAFPRSINAALPKKPISWPGLELAAGCEQLKANGTQ